MEWVSSTFTVPSIVNNAACIHCYIRLKYSFDVRFYHEQIRQFYTLHYPYVPFKKKNHLFAKTVKTRMCSLKTRPQRHHDFLLGCMYVQGESFSISAVSHFQHGSPRDLISRTCQAPLRHIAHVGKYIENVFFFPTGLLFQSWVLFLSLYSKDTLTSLVKPFHSFQSLSGLLCLRMSQFTVWLCLISSCFINLFIS